VRRTDPARAAERHVARLWAQSGELDALLISADHARWTWTSSAASAALVVANSRQLGGVS
jgi:hypothetical protein